MGLFDRSASKLSGRTTLLLAADPGDALLNAARLYDPDVRPSLGRLVFRNGGAPIRAGAGDSQA